MRNLFIRWYRRNREATIDDINLPDDLHAGWELTGQFDKNLNPLTDEGYLIFTPDYEVNEETLVALVYYKNKYYMSNQLTLINRVDAKNDQIEDIKKDLMDQAEKDRELIDANKRAVNALVIESGYYAENEDGTTVFNNNNGLYFYYTRSGLIRESEKLRTYGLRCYSSDKDTIIKSLAWEFPQKNTMVKINGGAAAEGGYYKQLITIDRKYNPSKTNNIVTITATCDITVRDENDNIKDVYENVIIENQIELLFGYYSCEGTEHSLTAYWTNSAGEVVNCLVPGKEYKAHLLLDGKEVTSPIWSDVNGDEGLTSFYTPTIGDVHMRKGIVSISDAEIDAKNEKEGKTDTTLRLGCWLAAKISYNEDNIIEGMTQLIYQSDGTTHMRDSASEADVVPQYRLELLLEDGVTHNQQYADGIYWDPYTGAEIKKEKFDQIQQELNNANHKTNNENKENGGQKKQLVNGFLYDAEGEKPVAYFSGPSNWSIGVYNKNNQSLVDEYFMRDVDGDYETWKNGTSVECPYFSLVYNSSANESSLLRSTVDLQPKGVYFETMSNYIFSINVYTYTGYVLARIPLRIDVNRYPSIYIDKMAKYDGGIKIDETLGTIYAPRFLAGRYENPDNIDNTGNKQFSGVAIGDFADKDTEASMAIPGIYGFKQGQQAYAFRNNGTGFIGANGNTRITFNNGGSGQEVLTIGDTNHPVFSVNAAGNVNLTGSVTGYSNETQSGYQLNIDGSGYIGAGKSAIHFEPNVGIPLYIGDTQSTSNFSVASNGSIYLNGDIVFSNPGKVANSIKDKLNIPEKMTADDVLQALQDKSTDGLFAFEQDGTGKTLVGIKATAIDTKALSAITISADQITGLTISASNITAGTLEAKNVGLDGVFTVYDQCENSPEVHGYFGAGHGRIDNNTETHGIGLTAGGLTLSDLDSRDSVKWQHSGGYVFVTNAGARIGYREYLYDDKIQHNRIILNGDSVKITVYNLYTEVSHSLTFNNNGELYIDGKKVKLTFE